MPWLQVYDPLNSPFLSTFVAALPIVVLLGLLGWGHVSAHLAAAAGLVTALVAAVVVFHMPATTAMAAAVDGAAYGLFPIGWIVVMAIFLYALTVDTGQFEVVKRSVASLSPDRRIQALLIAFSFGAFVEGAAGFGTPVAISSALLIGAGFPPLQAAGMALIAPFGSAERVSAITSPSKVLESPSGAGKVDWMMIDEQRQRLLASHRDAGSQHFLFWSNCCQYLTWIFIRSELHIVQIHGWNLYAYRFSRLHEKP